MQIKAADFSDLSILVIDDSHFIRRLLIELLTSFGVGDVQAVESAEAAFRQIDIARPDLIICDWEMHPVDGLTVLRMLRQGPQAKHPRIPFIMLTGHNGSEDVAAAVGEGADSYIVKPFTAETVMSHLLKVIESDKGHLLNEEVWGV